MVDIKNLRNKIEFKKEPSVKEMKDVEKDIEKTAEAPKTPETIIEKKELGEGIELEEGATGAEISPGLAASQTIIHKRSERKKQVEQILSEDMKEAYLNMPQAKKDQFKREGEKTAGEINMMLEKTKVNINKIISLIRKWLSIIPGMNKFFLEQESKIKADKIMRIKNEQK